MNSMTKSRSDEAAMTEDLTTILTPTEMLAHDAFEAWRHAKQKSDRTINYDDAVVTAKAWAKFQDLFCNSEASTMKDDFSWNGDEEALVVRQQAATAVYLNQYDEIVIRQQGDPFGEDDDVVVLTPDSAINVVLEIQRLLVGEGDDIQVASKRGAKP